MKVYEIINERVSSVIYHVIDFNGAQLMLEQDKLRQQDVSFTRSLTGEYHIGNKMIGVVFQFDGDLLNQKFKGAPVGTEDWDLDDTITMRGKENKQLEDRLKTKDGLTEVTKYIKSAIMFCPKEFVEDSWEDEFDVVYADSVKHIASVQQLLTAKKIPFRYVSTVKELFNKNVNNKQGFLEAVAMADEATARKLGLEITKKYKVYMVYSSVDEHGDIDPESYDEAVIVISANSEEDAQKQGAAAANQKNKQHADMFDDSGSWEVHDIEEEDEY